MIWYNKTKTKCLDTSKVSYWEYTSGEEQKKSNEAFMSKVGNILPTKAYLLVVVDGCERGFDGNEAEEIYNIFKNQKEVI